MGSSIEDALQYAKSGRFSIVLISPTQPYFEMGNLCSQIKTFNKDITVISIIGSDCSESLLYTCRTYSDYRFRLPLSMRNFLIEILNIMNSRHDIFYKRPKCGRIYVGIDPQEVYICGKEIQLTDSEFSILRLLAIYYPRHFKSEEILDCCFGSVGKIGRGNVATHISSINKKSRLASSYHAINNTRGHGYILNYIE
ncbi:MAG: winged-helix domain-containing protein [Clostridiales bacterium]|nr:winged-helix domain-containing protein [Clostridiales bacterium]